MGSYSYGETPSVAADSPELGEEDVWSTVEGVGADRPTTGEWDGGAGVRSRRRVPRGERHVGGLSLAFEDSSSKAAAAVSPRIVHQFRGGDGSSPSPRGCQVATSAPVNVPDWSKIYRANSVESMHDSDDADDGDGAEMVPPHEYLARVYRQMAANSVFEGVGRTLKGRDMSRVRDAVWSQTGFDG